MSKVLLKLGVALYVAFALIAFAYFGPEPYASKILSSSFFQSTIAPWIDPFIYSDSAEDSIVARAELIDGRLENKAPQSFSFRRSRMKQPFSGNTFLKTNSSSHATVELVDGSEITLAPDSLVLIKRQSDASGDNLVLSVQVQQGQVQALKKANAKPFKGPQKNYRVYLESAGKKPIPVGKEKLQLRSQPKLASQSKIFRQQLKAKSEPAIRIGQQQPTPQRQPASVPKKKITRPKRTLASKGSQAQVKYQLAPGSFLTKAKISKFRKQDSASYRHAAKTLVVPSYHQSEGFNSALRSALDLVLESRNSRRYCKDNLLMLRNLKDKFASTQRSPASSVKGAQNFRAWSLGWKRRLSYKCRGIR